MTRLKMILLATGTCLAVLAANAEAGESWANRTALRHARTMPWHANYYHTAYGSPMGLVVPPTANMQVKMGWGVSQSEMVPLYHQYYRAYPGDGNGSSTTFRHTPNWPSHTDQFGVYYIRGPW